MKDDAEAPRRALQRVQSRAKNSAEQMVRSPTAHTTITAAVFSPASLIFFPPCKEMTEGRWRLSDKYFINTSSAALGKELLQRSHMRFTRPEQGGDKRSRVPPCAAGVSTLFSVFARFSPSSLFHSNVFTASQCEGESWPLAPDTHTRTCFFFLQISFNHVQSVSHASARGQQSVPDCSATR